MTSFLLGPTNNGAMSPLAGERDHLINKKCYASLWGYEYIFAQYYGFDNETMNKAPWLRMGTWNRLPHVQDGLDRMNPDDWILFTDLDYAIKDMGRPLSSYIAKFHLNGLDPHVILPNEIPGMHSFSAFVFMIRNSDFGRSVLRHMHNFAVGICPKGNFELHEEDKNGRYGWQHTDQPGFWYGLIKAHQEFYPNDVLPPDHPKCNLTTGYIDEDSAGGPWLEIGRYFGENGVVWGASDEALARMPKNQPIIWTGNYDKPAVPGLGLQLNWGGFAFEDSVFGIHEKKNESGWPEDMRHQLRVCQEIHGCTVHYDDTTRQFIPTCNITSKVG